MVPEKGDTDQREAEEEDRDDGVETLADAVKASYLGTVRPTPDRPTGFLTLAERSARPGRRANTALRWAAMYTGFGYLLYPPAWIGARPAIDTPQGLASIYEVVVEAALPEGLQARVRRDGLVVFGVADWPLGAPYKKMSRVRSTSCISVVVGVVP